MEGQLVQKTFTTDEISIDCWVIKIDNKFWFKAHDIAVFLGYQSPDDAVSRLVPSEGRRDWDELRPPGFQGALKPPGIPGVQIPPNWKPHTVLISEGGLYRLLCKSTKPAAIKFEKWIFDDPLATLRETGTYTIKQQLQFSTEQLTAKDEQVAIKDERIMEQLEHIANQDEHISKLCEKVAVVTIRNSTKHVFQLYKHKYANKSIFIRAMSKRLPKALKVVNLKEYELLLNEINVPNAMNILNRVK